MSTYNKGGPISSGTGRNLQRNVRPVSSVWPAGYLKNGYFDDKGNLLPAVVIDWPQQIAKMFYKDNLQTAQLRKFFAEVRLIESQLMAGKDFNNLKPRILKLQAYAFYSNKKHNAPDVFKEFFERNIKWASANSKGFLEGFVHHFECVVAYFPKAN